MRRHVKKWMLLVGLVCVMSFMLSGCGGGENREDPAKDVKPIEDNEDSAKDIKPEENVPDEAPSLEGQVKELGDKEFTAIAAKVEGDENSSISMAMPAPGSEDDSDYETAVVTYDENTAFSIRTIYDGGERYEDSEATEKDLAEDVSINVWGEESGGKIKAETIRIINVVF